MLKKNIRIARSLIGNKKYLPRYYSEEKQILSVAYDYVDEATRKDKEYVEQVSIAVEQVNEFGLVRLIYKPQHSTYFSFNCPIDEMYLRKKHLNQIIFGRDNDTVALAYMAFCVNSVEDYVELMQTFFNKTDYSWSHFAEINANIAHPEFQSRGIGVLVHEIFHLFGIQDLFKLHVNCTNGIFYSNINAIRECEDNITQNTVACILENNIDTYPCQNPYNFNFTPVSLFSLLQYRRNTIERFMVFNKTRVSEILTENYQFTYELQKDYFSLLEKYQGRAHFITYQDISALAQAIYLIAPDSLLGRQFNMPNYYLVKGMYRPLGDEEKFIHLISVFKRVENFNYPILAQEDMSLTIYKSNGFEINLFEKLKLVPLTSEPVYCFLNQEVDFIGGLQVTNGCMLKGFSQAEGSYRLSFTLSNNLTAINRFIQLNIVEKPIPIGAIVVGKPSVRHVLIQNATLDLIALCHVVALPKRDELVCDSLDFPENLSHINCSVLGIDAKQSYNFTVNFLNKIANKTCKLQLVAANDSMWGNALINQSQDYFSTSFFELKNISNTHYYARQMQEDYSITVNELNASIRFITSIGYQHINQFNYLCTIPLLHGLFEGYVDEASFSSLAKLILKLLPRIGLVSINYLSSLQFPFLFFYGVVESMVASHFTAKKNSPYMYALHMFSFFLVTELEYGFSNLWLLADKPEFWPTLTERFNKLFIQMIWAPVIKSTGYLLAVSIMNCYYDNSSRLEAHNLANTMDIERNECQKPAFFNSLKNVKAIIFSNKIKTLPGLFHKQFFGASPMSNDEVFEYKGFSCV